MTATITRIDDRTAEWTDEYGEQHEGYVEMILAVPDEYPAEVVAAVVAATP